MGLDITVGEPGGDNTIWAFRGAYSAFHRWRGMLLRVLGGWGYGHNDDTEERRNKWRFPEGMDNETNPGLFCLFNHSDSSGEIQPDIAALLAAELESMLPAIEERGGTADGHLGELGYCGVTKKFIQGCWQSAAAGVPLTFW